MEYKIYTLTCPISKEVVYVGKTKTSLEKRLASHINSKDNIRRRSWIHSLKQQNEKPIINLFKVTDSKNCDKDEQSAINYFKSIGCCLLNGNSAKGFKKKQITIQLDKGVISAIENESNITGKSKQHIINERLKQSYGIN